MGCIFKNGNLCKNGISIAFGCPTDCKYRKDDDALISNDEEATLLSDTDKQLINVCKKIRKMAALDRVEISKATQQHNNSDNRHLFNFIELCGMTVREFILNYLSNLQPFQLELYKAQAYDKAVRCIIDFSYNTPIYLKVEFTPYDVILVSFHENQNKRLDVYKDRWDKYSLILTSTDANVGEYTYSQIKIAHGLLVFTPFVAGKVMRNDVIRVNSLDLATILLQYANDKISDLIDNSIPVSFSSIKQLSFTSYGAALLNDVSILVDAAVTIKDTVLLNAFSTIINSKLSEIKALDSGDELLDALDSRYSLKSGELVKRHFTRFRYLVVR